MGEGVSVEAEDLPSSLASEGSGNGRKRENEKATLARRGALDALEETASAGSTTTTDQPEPGLTPSTSVWPHPLLLLQLQLFIRSR